MKKALFYAAMNREAKRYLTSNSGAGGHVVVRAAFLFDRTPKHFNYFNRECLRISSKFLLKIREYANKKRFS